MRYPEDAPPEVTAGVNETWMLVTAIYCVVMGVGFVIAGRAGRQLWLAVIGVLLVVFAVSYLIARALGYH